jgi:hypothetical protein
MNDFTFLFQNEYVFIKKNTEYYLLEQRRRIHFLI